MYSKSIFVMAALIFGVQALTAQISGKIIDASDGSPLEYATAALYKQANGDLVTGVVTSMDGSFIIERVKPGTYYLEASFMGYDTKTISNISIDKKQPKQDLSVVGLTFGTNWKK